MTEALGERVQIVGDDLFVTNTERLHTRYRSRDRQQHSDQGEPNRLADRDDRCDPPGPAKRLHDRDQPSQRRNGRCDDRRSGSALCTGQIKTGSASRTDRMAKYNQLLRSKNNWGPGPIRWAAVSPAVIVSDRELLSQPPPDGPETPPPLGESPWLWLLLFSLVATIPLSMMHHRYSARQRRSNGSSLPVSMSPDEAREGRPVSPQLPGPLSPGSPLVIPLAFGSAVCPARGRGRGDALIKRSAAAGNQQISPTELPRTDLLHNIAFP